MQGTRHTGAGEWSYYSEALARLRALPGVTAAGAVGHLPLGHGVYMANTFKLDSGQDTGHTVVNAVTPGYFRAIGTKFLAGGDFAENAGHQPLVIVNEAFAKGTGLGNGIVGRRVIAPWGGPPYRVTGVVSTERFGGPAYPGEPEVYWQIEEEPPAALTLVARVTGDAQAYALRCRDSVRAIDASVPIYDVAPLEQRLDEALARPRFYTTATLFLGSLALLLAAIGSYGTLSYSIAQRTHEMGVRMAVGASSWLLRRMLLREGLLPILAGIAVGVILSLASIQLLQHLTENKTAALPAVWAAFWGAAVLSLTGVIAVWNASDQILSINPTDALRSE